MTVPRYGKHNAIYLLRKEWAFAHTSFDSEQELRPMCPRCKRNQMEKNGKKEDLLHDISAFLEDAADELASGTDAEGLPFESIEDFETLPIEFEEEHTILLNRTEDLFVLCQRYNRHSKKFLEACTWLDQSIRSLASVCVTRIALIKVGAQVPQLHQLSTHKLFMMTSFNYRKINAAIEEEMKEKQVFSLGLMKMLVRCHQTLERLRKTETKINKINIGEISAEDIRKSARTFSEKSPNRWYTANQNEVPEFREAISFPVDNDVIRENLPEPDEETEASESEQEGTVEIVSADDTETAGSEQDPEEPTMVIDMGGGETVLVTVPMAKSMLQDPQITQFPELEKALREFINST